MGAEIDPAEEDATITLLVGERIEAGLDKGTSRDSCLAEIRGRCPCGGANGWVNGREALFRMYPEVLAG